MTTAPTPHIPFLPAEVEEDGVTVADADLVNSAIPQAPFRMARFTVPAGGTSSPDVHAVQEIWVVQAGTGTLVVDGTHTVLRAGSVVGFPSHAVHEAFADQGEDLDILSLWWDAPDA
ncbi:cupin domain-containing protein [Streptomyces gibsoniae]|uniref:Cupin domain-containing protein n=1 Tax=Streptomyces gibsoniae TaxID=3075529 RepID=A0ABU2U417_9ACTN|nr:cupin domain-containing protein [Streptomyces sp. DSM 41699]MDT0467791.1 cupin domain-containing protein [Streptomyces sp. DSM 41699]